MSNSLGDIKIVVTGSNAVLGMREVELEASPFFTIQNILNYLSQMELLRIPPGAIEATLKGEK